jgi:acetyl esterase/lipase
MTGSSPFPTARNYGLIARMKLRLLAIAVVVLLFGLATPVVLAQRTSTGSMIQRTDLNYASDPRQRLILWTTRHKGRSPLMIYIHGGGWSAGDPGAGAGEKPRHFLDQHFVYASITYRFVPQVTVEDQIADVARAIAWLRKNAGNIGADPDRIVLIGHSSGAHLAAMIASDPQWLAAAKVPFATIRAAILLDGAGFDVPTMMAGSSGTSMPYYGPAFGADPARRLRLSPIGHLDPPNAPAWLFLQDARRVEGYAQAEALAGPLRAGGATTTIVPVPDSGHMPLNNNLGIAGDFATAQMDSFLAALK